MKTERALAIRTATPPAVSPLTRGPFRQPGSRTAIQTATGSVAVIFALVDYDKRLNAAAFSLRVINKSDTTLVCRVWAITRYGEALFAYPPPFEIAAHSAETKELPVLLDEFDAFERALAEINGDGVHMIVEAAAPAVRRKPSLPSMLAAGAFIACVVFAAAALRMSLPRILALAAPPTVSTGTTVDAQYATSGLGQVRYLVEAPDGRHIQGGALVEKSGAISIAIPRSRRPGAYTLRLTEEGPLGTDKEIRVINAEPPPIIYRKGAQTPGIAIAPLVSRIIVAMRDAKLLVALRQSTAQGIASADGQDPAPTKDNANGVFQVEKPLVKSRGTIGVRILSPRNGMLLSLTDMQSRQISSKAVGVDQDFVQLRAPRVGVSTRYTVVMSFEDGFGQETIVQTVTVAP